MANKHHSLRQTYSDFRLTGRLNCIHKDNFTRKGTTGTGKKMNMTNITLEIKEGVNVNGIQFKGFQLDNVTYFKVDDKGNRDTFTIPWSERYNEAVINLTCGENARLQMSKNVALDVTKKDDNGKLTIKKLTSYDVTDEILRLVEKEQLTDESWVNVRGKIVTSESVNREDGSITRYVNFDPTGIYLTNPKTDIDDQKLFDGNNFTMEIIVKEFNEINGKIIMRGIVIGYDNIGEIDFGFYDHETAKIAMNALKPYTMFKCTGLITQEKQEETVVVEQNKGGLFPKPKLNTKTTAKNPYGRNAFLIVDIDENSIDTKTYSEEAIIQARKELAAYAQDYRKGQEKVTEETTSKFGKSKLSAPANIETDDDDDDLDW